MARRFVSLGAVAALTLSIGFFASTSAGASGPKPPKGKSTCTTISGSVLGGVSISGCTDKGMAIGALGTGGGSEVVSTSALIGGGDFTWLSGGVSTVSAPTVLPTSAKKCPGYVKPPKGTTPPEPTAVKFSGDVITDNAGFKVPGKLSGAVCVGADGDTITGLKVVKIS